MLDLNRQQRSLLADKLADTGNLAVAGMVFSMTGYFILFGGMLAFAALFVITDWLNGRRERRSHHASRS